MKTFEEALAGLLALSPSDGETPAGKILEANVGDIFDTMAAAPGTAELITQMACAFRINPSLSLMQFALSILGAGVQIGIAMEKQEVLPDVTTHIN